MSKSTRGYKLLRVRYGRILARLRLRGLRGWGHKTAWQPMEPLEPRVLLSAGAIPDTPDLVAVSDTGASSADNLTRLDNSSPTRELVFSVPGTVAGNTVRLYADAHLIGTALAGGATTLVTTNGTQPLSGGTHAFNATQFGSGQTESDPSAALAVTIDNVAPSVNSILRSNPTGITTGASSVGFTVIFNEPVTGVDASDFATAAPAATVTAGLPVVSGSGSVYTVTIGGIKGYGQLGLNLVDNNSIRDAAGNALTSPGVSAAFQAPAPYAAGLNPVSVTAADVNGDGKLDLMVANQVSDNVSVLLGNGNGAFQGQGLFATGTAPDSVRAADVSGDGKVDLVVANASSNNVSVLLGTGTGAFLPQATYATGVFPTSVAIADLNRDGKPDLITANVSMGSNNVSVLLGNGDGTFQTQTTFAAGLKVRTVIAVDVNADGIPDLVVANVGEPDVNVLLGVGDGTFLPRAPYATGGSSPFEVTAADVNGDGKTDLITSDPTANGVCVLLGNGNGTFQSSPVITTGNDPLSVTAADVNGDGRPEIIAANYQGNGASVLFGNFQPQATFVTGPHPFSVTTADLNGDGRPDMVVTNSSAGPTVSVMLNADNGSTTGPTYNIIGVPVVNTTVDGPGSPGQMTLRGAVIEANVQAGPDTITFDPSVFTPGSLHTITLTQGPLELVGGQSVTITGPGANTLAVSGNNADNVLLVDGGASASITGLTITGGNSLGSGGAIYNNGALTLAGSTISGNQANEGGGIFNDAGGNLSLTNCTLSANHATGSEGGAIYNNGGTLTIVSSTISSNSTVQTGGGIFNNGVLNLTGSVISGNQAYQGGGVLNYQGGNLGVTNCTFSANHATGGDGGGIYDYVGTLSVVGSTIASNTASGGGAGIFNTGGNVTVDNSTLWGNTATVGGGGIWNYQAASTLTVRDSTIAGNSTTSGGAGIDTDGIAQVFNTLVAANTGGGDIAGTLGPASGHDLIGDGRGGLAIGNGNILGTPASPIDAKLGPLASNGGPTQTLALLAGSPAIDAGSNPIVPGALTTDQRGTGFPRFVNTTVDIGAFEFANSAAAVVIDNTSAKALASGLWTASTTTAGFIGSNYLQDGNTGKGAKTVTYSPALSPGGYQVFLNSVGSANRATNVPVDIFTAGGHVATAKVNEQTSGYILLGTFNLDAASKVVIRTTGTNGYVAADAIKFVPAAAPVTTVIDNTSIKAAASGSWTTSISTAGYIGSNYLQDGNTGKGTKSVTYTPALAAKPYEILLHSVGGANRATNVPVDIYLAGGIKITVTVNEQTTGWISLGVFNLDAISKVVIRTDGTNGYVVADAMEFIG